MKKLMLLVVFVGLTLSFTNCMSVHMVAPPSSDVRMLAELEPAYSKITYKNWYVLWGLVPITENSTDGVLAKHGFKEARVTTEFTLIDWLIDAVLGGFSIITNTTTIEGNLK
jgi:hypothetical protein